MEIPYLQTENLCGKLYWPQRRICQLTIIEDCICNLANNDNSKLPWNPNQNYLPIPPQTHPISLISHARIGKRPKSCIKLLDQ